MKTLFLILCTIFSCCLWAVDVDFSFKPGLPGWTRNNRTIYFDKNEKAAGNGSLKLVNTASVSRSLSLEAGAEYEVSVYIKARDITGGKYKGVLLRLTDGKRFFAVTGRQDNLPQQGTFDWIKCTRRFKSSLFKNNQVTIMPALTCKGTAWFCNLKIVKIKGKSENGYFRKSYGGSVKQAVLIPGGIFGFFTQDQDVTFDFLVDGPIKGLTYTLAVRDESGKTIYRVPQKKFEKNIRIPKQKNGYYVVDTELFANGKKAYFFQSAFAVAPVIKKLDPFFQFSYGASTGVIPGLKRVGGGSVNLTYSLVRPLHKTLSPAKAAARFLKTNQLFLDDPDLKLGILIGCSIGSVYRDKDDFEAGFPLLSNQALKHLLETVSIIHGKTRSRVREWGVGCEIPSNAQGGNKKILCGTWTEAMFNMMVTARMVSRQLKKSDPGILFFCGGNNRQDTIEPIDRIVMSDLVKDFDEYAIDGYTGNWNMLLGSYSIPELRLAEFYKIASRLSESLGKGKVIRNNETGYAINYGARFDGSLTIEQAYLTARTIIITRFSPVSRFELHMPTSHSPGFMNPKDSGVAMTTIWRPLHFKKWYDIPLPGGAMYVTAASELSYAKSLAEVKNGNIYCYLFRKPDGSVLITLWNIAGDQKFSWNFPGDARAVNMYGRSIPVKDLVIGKSPVYITVKMSPEKAVAMMKKAILSNTPEFKCSAYPDKVCIRSYSPATRECRLLLPGQKEKKVKLLPGTMTEIKTSVSGSGKLIAPDGRVYNIPLLKIDYYTVKRIKTQPVFDGSGSWLKGLPAGTLKYPEHIRPAEALQPERRYFKTSYNPDGHNISARYWTAYDDKNFYFAVKVDDPKHQQRQQPLDLWRDDSIQFVLSHTDSTFSADSGKTPRSEYNFALALTPKGTQLVKMLGKFAGLKEYPAKVSRQGNITFYEAAIPWAAVGGKAKRFGFVIFNNDFPTRKSAPYYLEFSAGIAGGHDDTKLKVIKYAD